MDSIFVEKKTPIGLLVVDDYALCPNSVTSIRCGGDDPLSMGKRISRRCSGCIRTGADRSGE